MDIELQLCGPDQVAVLHEVALQSYRQHYLYLWETEAAAEWYTNRSFSVPSLLTQMEDPDASFYLVVYHHTPCGFLKLNWSKPLLNETDSLELERIYLLQEFSGKGIGSAVVQRISSMAREKQKKKIWLKSMDSSPSIQFYQKAGFEKTAIERLPFPGFRDQYRNMWVMELRL